MVNIVNFCHQRYLIANDNLYLNIIKLSMGNPGDWTDKAKTLTHLVSNTLMKPVNFSVIVENYAELKIHTVRQEKTIKEVLSEFVKQLPGYF